MYDWIQRAPVKFENYSHNDNKNNGFGIRTLPPKPANGISTNQQSTIKKSFSTDKNLNIHGHNLMSTSHQHKPFSETKISTSSNKSLHRLLAHQEEVNPKAKPIPKQRKPANFSKLKDSDLYGVEEISNNYEVFIKAQQKNYLSEKLSGINNGATKELSDYENNVEDEYDHFKYMDETNLYDNCQLPNKENSKDYLDEIDGKHKLSDMIILYNHNFSLDCLIWNFLKIRYDVICLLLFLIRSNKLHEKL